MISEAEKCIAANPHLICFCEFSADPVRQVIIGMGGTPDLIPEVMSLRTGFPEQCF
jgi:hypothetical protein